MNGLALLLALYPIVPFDLAALAAGSKTVEIDEGRLRAALVTGEPRAVAFSAVLDLGAGTTAVAWSECSPTSCRGSVATMAGGRARKVVALPAPKPVFGVDGFAFEPPALADLDGDGAPEIVFHYRTTEPPRRGLGSISHEYVAVYSPKDLSLRFAHEIRRAGADSEDSCQWTFDLDGARLVAGGRCNQRACLEAATPPPGCRPDRTSVETWRVVPDRKWYIR